MPACDPTFTASHNARLGAYCNRRWCGIGCCMGDPDRIGLDPVSRTGYFDFEVFIDPSIIRWFGDLFDAGTNSLSTNCWLHVQVT